MNYLLVAHQTADSPELTAAAVDIVARDAAAAFVLVVPQSPVNHALVWDEDETAAVAAGRAQAGHAHLLANGLRVTAVKIGDADPVCAIKDELRRSRDVAGIVICTLPPGPSKWLRMDVPSRARRAAPGVTVVHVVATSARRSPVRVGSTTASQPAVR